ncbi:uncharacterized protein BKCO1_2700060 [Diplodia corticola]|uniref:Glycoprotease family protein n=1 Tax=Diplodia corticola TaxID=236234 RepID=A0A1J9QXK8_9PEZI|nr:uncharacterized protein BKCO1_2700060 [Diplodia corticola]OJD33766.1 hypothetical protein BKCO1_2700060 [Diplodia corticola]
MATLNPNPDFVDRDVKIQRVTRFPAAADFRSPAQPPAGLDSWHAQAGNFRAPPPYETPRTDDAMDKQGIVVGYQPSQSWEYDASRVAARQAFTKQKRLSSHLNKSKSKRRNKPFGQTMRPTIAVDTNYSRHRGPAPRQVFPAAVGGLFATGRPGMVSPEEEKAPSKFKWLGLVKSASIRKLRPEDRKESFDTLAPSYELQEKGPMPADDGFHFKAKTMRRNAPEVKPETKPFMVPFVPGPPPDPPVVHIGVPETPEGTKPPRMSPLDVSPSDRPITIGLTVSPEQVSEHDTPQSVHSRDFLDVHSAGGQRSPSPGSAETPTIIVTPAREKAGWLFPAMDNRPRPASSVYSRATNAYTVYNPSREHIPPVPAIPANFGTRNDNSPGGISTANGFVISETPSEPEPPQPGPSSKAQEIANTKKARVTSDATLFEEDNTPQSAGSLRGPTGLYIDTKIPPTPYRSQGWWNVITTPFEFTPSRFRFASNTPSDASTPILPLRRSFFSRSPDLRRNFSARSRAAQTPQSSSTAFSPESWERSSLDESPARTHDDLGISTVPSRESLDRSYQPEGAQSAISASDREIPVALGQGFEAARSDSNTNPAPPSHNNDSNNVFHLSSHYNFNGVPFYRDEDFVRRDTVRSTDTTPVVAVASLGTVLSARAVHEPYNLTNTPRSMNAYVEDASAEPRAASAAATPRRSTSTRRSSRPHDISMPAPAGAIPSSRRTSADAPFSSRRASAETHRSNQHPAAGFPYSSHRAAEEPHPSQREQAPYSNPPAPAQVPYFPPPPTQVHHHHHQQHNYFTQEPPSYGSPNEPLERGGTRRPFPGSPHYTEKPQKAAKAPKAPRQKGAGGYWHLFPKRAKADPNDPLAKKKKRRCCCWCCCITFLLILLIIMAALLGTLLPRGRSSDGGSSSSTGGSSTSPDGSPSATNVPDTPSVWLNLTGFPPIPTGVATIAEPDNSYAESGCVSPETMWSCAVPKEQQQDLAPNEPDQPNFKFQIKFVNGTISNTTALQPTKTKRSIQHRRWLNFLRTRDEPTASPSAPSHEDQAFLGNTTDGASAPFAGEDTPFYISFLNGDHVSSKRLAKRQSSTNGSIADIIPAPDVASDGTAAAANLLFFPANQPLKLYNRGAADEHYGFYNYFDRSIFLKNNMAVNSTDTGEIQADRDGGSTKDAAKVRCTWRQTRYLVQIWTQSSTSKALLATSTSSGAASSASSAADFDRPGSFPYPVTITLDRHGGNITEKMIYCYGMDDDGKIIDDSAKLQLENRDFGGTLVNPAQGPFGDVNVTLAEGGPGGIDGGTGGCGCKWRNWENA